MGSRMFSAQEIARMVSGYLLQINCEETHKSFLNEASSDLKLREFADLVETCNLNWNVDGRSLNDILNEYSE